MTVQILTADVMVPMDQARSVHTHAGFAHEDGGIVAIGGVDELRTAYPGAPARHLSDHVLMPGLVNAHHHSGMLRGTAEHLPVWEWLRLHIDPMHRVLRPEDAEAASWLCYAEGLLSGTTTVVDMWRYMDGAARAASSLGNRVVTVNYVGEHPDYDYFDTLDDNERMLAEWTGAARGRVMPWVGLEHPFYADDAGQRRAIALAQQYGTGLYTHCSESSLDVELFLERTGSRPMDALKDMGFMDVPRLMIAHAVWLDAGEIALMVDHGVSVSHNPVSNMKLASGFAPVAELLDAGIAVGIGTDGEKENNNLDMFEEMKVASLMGKLRAMDAAAMDSWQVLEMATKGGARAIGQGDRLGSLDVGKQADAVAVRTDTPRMTPLLPEGPYANIHHNLVHAVRGGDVTLTMVAGEVVVDDGRLVNASMPELIARVRDLVPGLFARRTAYLEASGEQSGLMSAH
ncbi:amidohydrolase family protein [Demequina capsici]|uniref:Amidohydrolase n=1 Tax=Demequina capsici TaxID=3075620 RepID=A0AA96F9K1_9MICO|nr:amidohydrolase [Demequina sp. OYTSA14]WNM24596.1 amidohydrolase [Demequina sp. OYTSA14]